MHKEKIGCFIIHGFGGNRQEIMPLVNKLKEAGYKTATPLLAGHETCRSEMAKARYNDWIFSAETELKKFYQQCDHVIIIGFSMGGLVATHLVEKHKVDALILINTPYYYWNISQIIKNIFSSFKVYVKKYALSGTKNPFRTLLEFLHFLNITKPLFKTINCPTLVMQTLDDDTVGPKSAEHIYALISAQKHIKKYKSGGHMIFEHSSFSKIYIDIYEFIKTQSQEF